MNRHKYRNGISYQYILSIQFTNTIPSYTSFSSFIGYLYIKFTFWRLTFTSIFTLFRIFSVFVDFSAEFPTFFEIRFLKLKSGCLPKNTKDYKKS